MEKEIDRKMSILYTIKGIQPYGPMEGYVAILLVPVDKIDAPLKKIKKPKINMIGMGPGGDVPPEVMEQMQDMFGQMMGMKKKDINDDRNIVIIEEETIFQQRGWKYGDTISADFEKKDI